LKTVTDTFVYFVSDEIVIDLGKMDDATWKKIKKNVQVIMKANQTDEIGMAYIAAFLIYLGEIEMMSAAFDPDYDLHQ
jgi:hypothetical protein